MGRISVAFRSLVNTMSFRLDCSRVLHGEKIECQMHGLQNCVALTKELSSVLAIYIKGI